MKVGDKIGAYEILEELGKGGKGIIYKITDASERVFALKTALPENEERLREDGRVQVKLNHKNIIKAYEVSESGILMEYIKGMNVAEFLMKNKLPELEIAVDWMMQISEGIAYAHSKEILHGDIKPRNIMLADEGPKMLDFGSNPKLEDCVGNSLTAKPEVVLSSYYVAPELINQFLNGKRIVLTKASDVYSLGAVFYTLLTAKIPTEGAPSLTEVRPELPERIRKIVNNAKAYNAEERYSAAELADELRDFLEEIKSPKQYVRHDFKDLPTANQSIINAEKAAAESPSFENLSYLIELYMKNSDVRNAVEAFKKIEFEALPEDKQVNIMSNVKRLFDISYLNIDNMQPKIYLAAREKLAKMGRLDLFYSVKLAFLTSCCKSAYYNRTSNKDEVYKMVRKMCSEIVDMPEFVFDKKLIVCNNLGIIFLDEKKYKKAKKCFEASEDKFFKVLSNNLAVAEAHLNNYKNAEASLEAAVNIMHNDQLKLSRIHNLAVVRHLAGKKEDAVKLANESGIPALAEALKKGRIPKLNVEFTMH